MVSLHTLHCWLYVWNNATSDRMAVQDIADGQSCQGDDGSGCETPATSEVVLVELRIVHPKDAVCDLMSKFFSRRRYGATKTKERVLAAARGLRRARAWAPSWRRRGWQRAALLPVLSLLLLLLPTTTTTSKAHCTVVKRSNSGWRSLTHAFHASKSKSLMPACSRTRSR